VLRRLGAAGFDDVTLAVGHLSHLICAVLGDGSALGVALRYHHEEEPLGTAGPLATIPDLDGTFLMLNGDVLTTLDLRALVRAHAQAGNLLTIATHRRVVRADYGVLHTDGAVGDTHRVLTYEEKPELPYTVSMGIYAVEPEAIEHIPAGRYYDLPDLVHALLATGAPVGSFPFDGAWLDIGREDDYRRAQAEAEVWQP